MDTSCAVYYCIYGNSNYSLCLNQSLESLHETNPEKDVYIFTDTDYQSQYANIVKTKFPTGRCSSMAYRFELGSKLLEKYEKILHLDNDTLVIKNLDSLFSAVQGDKIHFASEDESGKYKIVEKFWAGPVLTEEEKLKFSAIKSICAGVFAATKSSSENLSKCFMHVQSRGEHTGECADQHAVCEYVLKNNAYTHNLQDFVNHMPQNEQKHQTVYHFAGGVAVGNKPQEMKIFKGNLCK
jgi:lipopolysaccharide biosynthesis glycosyltransferase